MVAPPSAARAYFAARLKELRNRRGFKTARKLAQNLGIDENRYTRYERAEVEPDLSLFVRICEALATTPNELLGINPTGMEAPEASDLGSPLAESVPNRAAAFERPTTRYRALARRLAREIANLRIDNGQADDPLGRLHEISRVVAEIEADPFDYVARLTTLPELKRLDKAGQQRIAALAEQLMEALEDQFVAVSARNHFNPGFHPRSPSSPRK